jgi:hypothetical protein
MQDVAVSVFGSEASGCCETATPVIRESLGIDVNHHQKAGSQEKQACGNQPWQQRTRPQFRDREAWLRCNLGSSAGHPHTNLE